MDPRLVLDAAWMTRRWSSYDLEMSWGIEGAAWRFTRQDLTILNTLWDEKNALNSIDPARSTAHHSIRKLHGQIFINIHIYIYSYNYINIIKYLYKSSTVIPSWINCCDPKLGHELGSPPAHRSGSPSFSASPGHPWLGFVDDVSGYDKKEPPTCPKKGLPSGVLSGNLT